MRPTLSHPQNKHMKYCTQNAPAEDYALVIAKLTDARRLIRDAELEALGLIFNTLEACPARVEAIALHKALRGLTDQIRPAHELAHNTQQDALKREAIAKQHHVETYGDQA